VLTSIVEVVFGGEAAPVVSISVVSATSSGCSDVVADRVQRVQIALVINHLVIKVSVMGVICRGGGRACVGGVSPCVGVILGDAVSSLPSSREGRVPFPGVGMCPRYRGGSIPEGRSPSEEGVTAKGGRRDTTRSSVPAGVDFRNMARDRGGAQGAVQLGPVRLVHTSDVSVV